MSLLFDFINRQFLTEPPSPSTPFTNRTIIVTGASSGLGLEAVRLLTTLHASHIILAVRNPSKGDATISSLHTSHPNLSATTTLETWPLDLSSFASVLAFADRCTSTLPRLDALVANAGIWPHTHKSTDDGHEEALQTNVLATALLACALHPLLARTAREFGTLTRVAVVGSELYELAAFRERNATGNMLLAALDDEKTTGKKGMADRYHTTKLLVLLVAREMARLRPLESGGKVGVVVSVVAPGFCYTGLGQQDVNLNVAVRKLIKVVARDPAVGARTLVYGACAPAEAHGGYLPDCKLMEVKGLAAGEEGRKLQARVWSEVKEVLEGVRKGVTEL